MEKLGFSDSLLDTFVMFYTLLLMILLVARVTVLVREIFPILVMMMMSIKIRDLSQYGDHSAFIYF